MSATATRTLLITTDEPTSLTDAYAFIKLGNAGPHLPYAGCGSGDGFEFEDARRSGWVICDRRFV